MGSETSGSPHRQPRLVLVVAVVLVLGAMAFVLLQRSQRYLHQADQALVAQSTALRQQREVDPAIVKWRQVRELTVPLQRPTCLAAAPEGQLAVGGDRQVVFLAADGRLARSCGVPGSVQALALTPGRCYVAALEGLYVIGANGAVAATWPLPTGRSLVSGVAAAGEAVWLADAGKRLVWRLDRRGKILAQFGARNPRVPDYGVIAPSPHLKVLLKPDGTLLVNNLGRQRVDRYDSRGTLLASFGQAGMGVESFAGCCNPIALALLPDGRVVTAEKGLRRVKVYTAAGAFSEVVATATNLSRGEGDLDLATTAAGEIAVLDCAARVVRIFERTQ